MTNIHTQSPDTSNTRYKMIGNIKKFLGSDEVMEVKRTLTGYIVDVSLRIGWIPVTRDGDSYSFRKLSN